MVASIFGCECVKNNHHCLIQDGFSSLWDQSLIVKFLRQTVASHHIQVVSLFPFVCQFYLPLICSGRSFRSIYASMLDMACHTKYGSFSWLTISFCLQRVLGDILYPPWHRLLKHWDLVFLVSIILSYFLDMDLWKFNLTLLLLDAFDVEFLKITYSCFGERSWLLIIMVSLDTLTTVLFIVEYGK